MWNCGLWRGEARAKRRNQLVFGVDPGVESRKSLFFGVDPGEGVGEIARIAKIAEIENLTHQGFQKNV